MGTELLLGVRLTAKSNENIKLDDVNLKTKVEDLRMKTSERLSLPKDSFELIYCGCILEDDTTLESCGLKNGAMIYVVKKKEAEKPVPAKSTSERSILDIAMAFKSFRRTPALRSALHRLMKRSEVIENMIQMTPGLSHDSVAIALLLDPELMVHFDDPDTVRRAAELHPVILEAAQMIAAQTHSTAAAGPGPSSQNAPSTAYSYSLDNLSDDEEMAGDSSESSDSAHTANSAITAAQLAAALSRAGTRAFSLSSPSSTSASGNSGVITTEMFSQAMQQAFASAPSVAGLPPVPPTLLQPADLQRQLTQMHEIGLQDDTINVQALQFTNGDVQAAIDLVFSGFTDN